MVAEVRAILRGIILALIEGGIGEAGGGAGASGQLDFSIADHGHHIVTIGL
jgi:hypothetical protein